MKPRFFHSMLAGIGLLVCSTASTAQQMYLRGIPQSVIDSANTAVHCNYLTSQEQQVFLYVNLVRIHPKLFWKEVAEPYLDNHDENSGYYVKSLKSDLVKQKPLPLLYPDSGLYNVARVHAVNSGNKGWEGHRELIPRMKKYAPYSMERYGENCSYSGDSNDALAVVIMLLVDEGVNDLGHRKNILSAYFNCMGTSMHSHITYGYICVQDFGWKKP